MNKTASISGTLGGQGINGGYTASGTVELGGSVTLPAADTGTISAGVITVTSNSGVPNSVNGDTGHVFWTDGSGVAKRRYNCTFSVSGDDVTVTSGTGDALPSSGTVYCINSMTVSDEVVIDGTKITLMLLGCTQKCSVQFNSAVPAVLYEAHLSQASMVKMIQDGSTIAGDVATIVAANGSPTAATFTWGALLSA